MSWLGRLLGRRKAEDELERELAFHREEQVSDYISAGTERREAERRARWAMGDGDGLREACRDARGTGWVEDLGRDLRHGLRLWRRQPGFTAIVFVTLGLGIGLTTLMATLVQQVIYKPLAFGHPERLVSVQERTGYAPNATAVVEGWGNIWGLTYPNYEDAVHGSRSLELGAWSREGDIVSEPGSAEYVLGDEVTANLFPVLGVAPMAGRNFLPEEDRVGAAAVAIVSDNLAQSRFGSARAAVGGRVNFGGKLYTVVGVMPAGFDLNGYTTADPADIYTPLGQDTSPNLQNRGRHMLGVAARLRPGATLAGARQELEVIARRLQAQYPATNKQRDFLVQPWRADVGSVSTSLWLMLAAAGLVLLIGCANAASLTLTRALAREPELAMRAALGAGRGRLVRQCLTECALLGAGSGLLGYGLAAAGLPLFLAAWPGGLPRAGEISLNGWVLAAALAASVGSGLIFGLAPALRLQGRKPGRGSLFARGSSGRGLAGGKRRLHGSFVAAEVALALILLGAAGMLGRTLVRLQSLRLGVDTRNVVSARVALPDAVLADTGRTRAAWNDLLRRLRALPEVETAAMVDTVPLREGNNPSSYWTGTTPVPDDKQPTALTTTVGADYFQSVGIPLLQGRYLDERDRMGTTPTVVIDEVLAHHAFGNRSPIGQPLHLGMGNDPLTIVGVVGHVRYWGPAADDESPVRDQLYYAFDQLPDRFVKRWSQLMSVTVRTRVPPGEAIGDLRAAVGAGGSGEALYEVRTLAALAHGSLDQQRFLLFLFGVFAGLALILACGGVYAVQAMLAQQRLPELGVRVALGAGRGDVFWLVMRQSLGVVLVGLALGAAGALGANTLLRHAVAGVDGVQAATLAGMALVLLAAAAAASLPAARRASHADPMRTLRQQ